MDQRFIVRHMQTLRCAVVMATAMLASGCAQILGIEDLPSNFAVRGTAAGMLGPVALELRLGGDVELLAVTEEGPFVFETPVADGTSYTVVLADPDVPCTLRNQTGVVAGAEPAVELTCTGASLGSVVVSGLATAVTLVPGKIDYVVDLPLSQPAVALTATVATDGDTLTIAGTSVASGAPSLEIPLSLGDNPVDIVVESAMGWERTYHLTLRRAAEIAQYAYGKAPNTGEYDQFGFSVALSGDTLAVGVPYEDSAATGVDGDQDDNSATDSGAVYVFRRSGTAWLQEAYLKASNTGEHSHFGWSVALAGDTLAVGARGEDSDARGVGGNQGGNAAENSGAVFVFRRYGTAWVQEAYVKASDTGRQDYFGYSVALAGDTLAVGAPYEDSATQGVDGNQNSYTAVESGAVYVFRRTDTAWLQEAYVKASNTGADDYFGYSVALSDDTLAVGAWGEESAAQGVGGNQADNGASDSGAVYVFRRTGTAWQQEAYVKASNTDAYDRFGISVALSGDTLAVGALHEASATEGVGGNQDDNSASASGAVYVFQRTGTTWQQETYLKDFITGARDSSLIT